VDTCSWEPLVFSVLTFETFFSILFITTIVLCVSCYIYVSDCDVDGSIYNSKHKVLSFCSCIFIKHIEKQHILLETRIQNLKRDYYQKIEDRTMLRNKSMDGFLPTNKEQKITAIITHYLQKTNTS
jgi:hypothetical protein